MKSAIITGAGGFIGGALAEKLLKQGVEVIAVDVDLEQLKKRFPFPNVSSLVLPPRPRNSSK